MPTPPNGSPVSAAVAAASVDDPRAAAVVAAANQQHPQQQPPPHAGTPLLRAGVAHSDHGAVAEVHVPVRDEHKKHAGVDHHGEDEEKSSARLIAALKAYTNFSSLSAADQQQLETLLPKLHSTAEVAPQHEEEKTFFQRAWARLTSQINEINVQKLNGSGMVGVTTSAGSSMYIPDPWRFNTVIPTSMLATFALMTVLTSKKETRHRAGYITDQAHGLAVSSLTVYNFYELGERLGWWESRNYPTNILTDPVGALEYWAVNLAVFGVLAFIPAHVLNKRKNLPLTTDENLKKFSRAMAFSIALAQIGAASAFWRFISKSISLRADFDYPKLDFGIMMSLIGITFLYARFIVEKEIYEKLSSVGTEKEREKIKEEYEKEESLLQALINQFYFVGNAIEAVNKNQFGIADFTDWSPSAVIAIAVVFALIHQILFGKSAQPAHAHGHERSSSAKALEKLFPPAKPHHSSPGPNASRASDAAPVRDSTVVIDVGREAKQSDGRQPLPSGPIAVAAAAAQPVAASNEVSSPKAIGAGGTAAAFAGIAVATAAGDAAARQKAASDRKSRNGGDKLVIGSAPSKLSLNIQ